MVRSTILAFVAVAAAVVAACLAATAAPAAAPVLPTPQLLTGTQTPPPTPLGLATAETIDLDLFARGLVGRLNGHVVGFSYAIARNGAVVRSGAGGYRRLAGDGGAARFTADTMAQAASASKTITAAALIKALHERGLSVDTSINSYLPRCWKKGPSVSGLTFRDLLGHHSLLPQGSGCSADPLKCILEIIAKGHPALHDQDGEIRYEYNNTVYGLMRVLLPFVRSRLEMQLAFGWSRSYCSSHTEELNEIVSTRFRDYVYGHVLGPVGVKAAFYPQGEGVEDYALDYNNADRTQAGSAPRDDFYLHAGAGYLAISARAYARFLSALDAGLIVPKALANAMKGVPGNRMGFDTSITGRLGEYVWKNGGCPSDGGTKPGCSTLAVVFPNGMQAYVAINSSNNTYGALYGGLDEVVRDAFDEALK
jgi:CubicO group peptidase (beta-lactamase class C family)